jgi:hypothetical protein
MENYCNTMHQVKSAASHKIMVVIVPDATSLHRPPIFGFLCHEGVACATLRVEEYNWWTLGSTCIQSVASLAHKHLEGEYHPSLAAAAQRVSHCVNGVRTAYMQSVRIYVDKPVPTNLLNASLTEKISANSSLARLHFETRVRSLPTMDGGAPSMAIGLGRPFIPHEMTEQAALNPSVWSSYRPPPSRAPESDASAPSASVDEQRTAPITRRDRDAPVGMPDRDAPDDLEGEGGSRKRRKKKRRRKPRTEPGAVVWDGDASSVPPVPLIVLRAHEDPGDRWHAKSTSLWVESLDPTADPTHFWRDCPSAISSFDEELPRIYTERRMLLEFKGEWERTVAMVRRALLQRLLASRELTMSELWTRRLEMGSEPCPVPNLEAEEWVRRHDAV